MSSGQALLNQVSGGFLGGYPNFGISMRFSVVVEGLETSHHLGLWQSCKSLGLNLNQEKLPQGGASVADHWLKGSIEYPPVTLERPMDKKSSNEIKKWLQDYVTRWDRSEDQENQSMIITLLDYHLNEVMTWELKNARPSKWSGPALNATDNKVAIETLVIEHDGFLGQAKVTQQASLRPDSGTAGKPVQFQFNPKTVTLVHEPELAQYGEGDSASIINPGKLSLSIPDLKFDGQDTLAKCEQLLKWTYADPEKQADKGDLYLPPLIFDWGNFSILNRRMINVTLTKVTVTYERFDPRGTPTRALVHIDLKCESRTIQDQQNPTSGGLPGRGGHVMVSGETLPGIALGTYGNPASWRAVAAANEVDDPLRMRPGSLIYLPSRTELAGGDAA